MSGVVSVAGLTFGLIVGYLRVRDAPPGQEGIVAAEESAAVLGSTTTGFPGGAAGGILMRRLATGAIATITGVGLVGYGAAYAGEKGGRWMLGGLVRAPITLQYWFGSPVYLDDVTGPPELIEGEPHTLTTMTASGASTTTTNVNGFLSVSLSHTSLRRRSTARRINRRPGRTIRQHGTRVNL